MRFLWKILIVNIKLTCVIKYRTKTKILAIYGPMIYCGQIHYEGNRDFLGPVKWHQAVRRVPFGAQKVKISRARPLPLFKKWIGPHVHELPGPIARLWGFLWVHSGLNFFYRTAPPPPPQPIAVNLNHKTYQKSTGNCNVHKGMLWYTKSFIPVCDTRKLKI